MNKELEEIKCIVAIYFGALGFLNPSENEQILKDRDKVLNALNELQSIKEANPSEALVCFENMQNRIASNISTIEYTTIEQALLKAQEPKQYLKWEDLEFSIDKQMMTVLLNGTKYTLIVGRNVHIDKLAFLRNGEINYYFLEDDKQFFNDLRLERVEE